MKRLSTLLFLLCTALLGAQTSLQTKPQQLVPATPESVGMSSERLTRLDRWLKDRVDENAIPGSMMLVARRGKIVHYSAVGYTDTRTKEPLTREHIFRIMSMSKAITSVAVMMLYEEGKFRLDDPVSLYIPEFKNPQVLTYFNEKDTTYTAVPAKNEVTIRHLLTHTAGIPYSHPLYVKAGIPDFFSTEPKTLSQTIPALARLPLMHEPGEKWTYGLNTDVLGYLVERVSGMRFGAFLKARIFDPLGMNDTGFYIPDNKKNRLMHLYTEPDSAQYGVSRHPDWAEENYPIAGAKTYESGGAGLTSTVLDYAKFLQMLLNGGAYNGRQLLGRKTIELMRTNQIGELSTWDREADFGLGFEIVTDKSARQQPSSPGTLSWGGRDFSNYWWDPKEELLCIWTSQVVPTKHWYFGSQVKQLVYQTLVD